jgi:hypothetical protein
MTPSRFGYADDGRPASRFAFRQAGGVSDDLHSQGQALLRFRLERKSPKRNELDYEEPNRIGDHIW